MPMRFSGTGGRKDRRRASERGRQVAGHTAVLGGESDPGGRALAIFPKPCIGGDSLKVDRFMCLHGGYSIGANSVWPRS